MIEVPAATDTPREAHERGRRAAAAGEAKASPFVYRNKAKLERAWRWGWDEETAQRERAANGDPFGPVPRLSGVAVWYRTQREEERQAVAVPYLSDASDPKQGGHDQDEHAGKGEVPRVV